MSRVQPLMPVGAYKTYRMLQPQESHFRPATCAEAGCLAYRHGWKTRVESLHPAQERAIRTGRRRFTEVHVAQGENWLLFEAGQPCFEQSTHRVPVGLPQIYVVQGGDWRGNPSGYVRRHVNGDDWTDDFATHQDRLATQLQRG